MAGTNGAVYMTVTTKEDAPARATRTCYVGMLPVTPNPPDGGVVTVQLRETVCDDRDDEKTCGPAPRAGCVTRFLRCWKR